MVKQFSIVGNHCSYHAEYRVDTSHTTVYTELVWSLLHPAFFFIAFHLGCDLFAFLFSFLGGVLFWFHLG